MDALEASIAKHTRKTERTTRNFGLGATDGALKLISSYFDTYKDIILDKLEVSKGNRGFRGKPRSLLDLDPDIVVVSSLQEALSSIGMLHSLTLTMRTIGRSLEDQCYRASLLAWNDEQANRLEAVVKRKHGSFKHRRQAIKSLAKRAGFEFDDWTDTESLQVGRWVLEALLQGPLFVVNNHNELVLTEDALGEVDQIMADLVLRQPEALPLLEPPPPWDSGVTHIGGIRYNIVRSYQKAIRKHVQRHITAGGMKGPLEALNAAQDVPWRISEPMLDLVKQVYEEGWRISSLPSKVNIDKPAKDKPWEDMDDTERRLWKQKALEVVTANRGFLGERIILSRDLSTAEYLRGRDFFIPLNFDYRGRIYGMPHFNFQRQDHIRCLFEFGRGQRVNQAGIYWLKVHLANVGAFDKVDKQPFDTRVTWVNQNISRILATAEDPMRMIMWWSTADSPFMFVAACKALADVIVGKPVHIPVSFDGSCSGLQHLCAMTKAEEGRLVNLTPADKPQDVYQVVADRVLAMAKAETETPEVAEVCLRFGIGRSLVKRNVMTYSYSSKRFGMRKQLLEDTMKPLSFKVLSGELPSHPFGEDEGKTAARYLANLTYTAIEQVVSKPAQAMGFLQTLARALAHESKPLAWTTPLDFPVLHRYPKREVKQINMWLHNKGIRKRFQPRSAYEVPGIEKREASNAVAPNFVHSLDACHLQMVVLEAKARGITSVALVHDSFGCLPNDAPKFRRLIKETFRDLYTKNDVLQKIREQAIDQMQTTVYKIPETPGYGVLNLEEIMEAEYAFA